MMLLGNLCMKPALRDQLRSIEGRHNPLLKELRRAFAESALTAAGCLAIEGVRMVEEAIRSGLTFEAVFFAESADALAERLLPQLSARVDRILVPGKLLADVLPSQSPQGVAALVRVKRFTLADILAAENPLILVAAGLQDPGNLGTLIRSAEAFGAAGLVIAEGTVSPRNAKVVRAAAGSFFRLPVVEVALAELVIALRGRGVKLVATSSHQGKAVDEANLSGPVALFIGNEGAGLPQSALQAMDVTVVIPQAAHVESLNAGVAGSVLLYEVARQRRRSKAV